MGTEEEKTLKTTINVLETGHSSDNEESWHHNRGCSRYILIEGFHYWKDKLIVILAGEKHLWGKNTL